MSLLSQSALWLAVAALFMGFSIGLRDLKNVLYWAYASVCLLLSLWAGFFFLDRVWPGVGFYTAHLVTHVWLAPALLLFIRQMVQFSSGVNRWLAEFSALGASLLTAAVFLGKPHADRFPVLYGMVLFLPALVALQLAVLLFQDFLFERRGASVEARIRLGVRRPLIFGGALVVLLFCSMDHVPWLGVIIPTIGNFLLMIYLFILSQMVLQQRFFNHRMLVAQVFVYSQVALLLTCIYAVLALWVQDRLGLFLLNAFAVSFMTIWFLGPLHELSSYLVKKLAPLRQLKLEEALNLSLQKMNSFMHENDIFDELMFVFKNKFLPKKIAIYALNINRGCYRKKNAESFADAPEEFKASHALIGYCRWLQQRGGLPLILSQELDAELARTVSKSQYTYIQSVIDALGQFNANLFIPFMSEQKIKSSAESSSEVAGFVIMDIDLKSNSLDLILLQAFIPYGTQVVQLLRGLGDFQKYREQERLAELGELSAGLAHEIRNPLGSILGAVQVIEGDSTLTQESELRPFLSVISEEVRRLNSVVEKFLDYSRKPQDEMQEVVLVSLLKKTIATLLLGQKQGCEIHFSPSEADSNIRILCNPMRVHQVILNVLQNALRAIERQKKKNTSEIKIYLETQGFSTVCIRIEDNGCGISEKDLRKVFIPFYTTETNGTGLGLSICKKIMAELQGRIEIKSTWGTGTTVFLYFPLLKVKEGLL